MISSNNIDLRQNYELQLQQNLPEGQFNQDSLFVLQNRLNKQQDEGVAGIITISHTNDVYSKLSRRKAEKEQENNQEVVTANSESASPQPSSVGQKLKNIPGFDKSIEEYKKYPQIPTDLGTHNDKQKAKMQIVALIITHTPDINPHKLQNALVEIFWLPVHVAKDLVDNIKSKLGH